MQTNRYITSFDVLTVNRHEPFIPLLDHNRIIPDQAVKAVELKKEPHKTGSEIIAGIAVSLEADAIPEVSMIRITASPLSV